MSKKYTRIVAEAVEASSNDIVGSLEQSFPFSEVLPTEAAKLLYTGIHNVAEMDADGNWSYGAVCA